MRAGTTYAFLPRASANRVFGAAVPALLAAELAVLDGSLPEPRRPTTSLEVLGGVEYVLATLPGPAYGAADLTVLSNLATLHALFRVEEGLLRPELMTPLRRHDEDLVTIQRYAGKTNEVFTHLLVNLALAATVDGFPRVVGGARLHLLDPVCGRGTTLNRAVLYGFDATGVEIDERDVTAYETFLIGWCKDKRLKHEVDRARLRKGRATPAATCSVTFGRGKDRTEHRTVRLIRDDTVHLGTHLRPRSVDLLACDLPYGVQHGARPGAGRLDRRPGPLLRAALPAWVDALRPGAGVALAWNRRTMARDELAEVVTGAGLEALTLPEDAFLHRVDRSITRDVLVARRPVGGPPSTHGGTTRG